MSYLLAYLILGACGLPIAISGETGYVYWPAFLGIIVAIVTFAPLGMKLAHALLV